MEPQWSCPWTSRTSVRGSSYSCNYWDNKQGKGGLDKNPTTGIERCHWEFRKGPPLRILSPLCPIMITKIEINCNQFRETVPYSRLMATHAKVPPPPLDEGKSRPDFSLPPGDLMGPWGQDTAWVALGLCPCLGPQSCSVSAGSFVLTDKRLQIRELLCV